MPYFIQAKYCNFFKGVAPWSPTEPIEWLAVPLDSQLCFVSQFMQNAESFSSLANTLEKIYILDKYSSSELDSCGMLDE